MLYTYAKKDNIADVYNVLNLSFDEPNPSFNMFRYLFTVGKFCLCVDDSDPNENKIIGLVYYVQLSKCAKLRLTCARKFNNDMWYIGYFCVLPAYRNQKIGKNLFNKALEDILQLNLNTKLEFIGLNCRRKNIIAQNIYVNFGFELWKFCLIDNYNDPIDDEMFMYKKIQLQPSLFSKLTNLFK